MCVYVTLAVPFHPFTAAYSASPRLIRGQALSFIANFRPSFCPSGNRRIPGCDFRPTAWAKTPFLSGLASNASQVGPGSASSRFWKPRSHRALWVAKRHDNVSDTFAQNSHPQLISQANSPILVPPEVRAGHWPLRFLGLRKQCRHSSQSWCRHQASACAGSWVTGFDLNCGIGKATRPPRAGVDSCART
jgi:hypothetical protein